MKTAKPDPFQFMIEYRKPIIEVLADSSTLSSAWDRLLERLPEIETITKFNTFKGYARILNVVDGKLSELEEKNNRRSKELGEVRQKKRGLAKENRCLSNELDKVRQEKKIIEDELGEVRRSLANIRRIDSVNRERVFPNPLSNPSGDTIPKRVDGWGVQLRGDYYRLFKKIEGKVKWIHIGRIWNLETARKKINSFHKQTR